MRILLVDDDPSLVALLMQNLGEHHYAIDTVVDGETAWDYVSSFTYDLIVLDVMLPRLDGISLCRQLRNHGHQMPILLLTAQDTPIDKIKGLDAGADDYVVKPCDLEELTARIRALLRRGREVHPPVLQWGDLHLDPQMSEVRYAHRPLHLTPKEYALLELFLRNPNRIFRLEVILDKVWSADELPGVETVRTHIKGLRRKLKTAGAPSGIIETVYGLGYRSPSPPPPQSSPSELAPPADWGEDERSHKAEMLAAIAQTWAQYKDQMMERLAVLEAAAQAWATGLLDRDQRQQAQQAAHSLAGTLGTFGFGDGSQLARKLETALRQSEKRLIAAPLGFGEQVAALRQQMQGPPNLNDDLTDSSPSPLLLLIDDDVQFAQALETAVTRHQLQLAIAPTLAQAQAQIQSECPDVVLLTLASNDAAALPRSGSLALLDQLVDHMPSVPVLVITARDQWQERLEVVRRGGWLCLESPLTPEQAITAITKVLTPPTTGAKVMIVDDDPLLLQALPLMLRPWGFECITLADPQQFWPVLTEVEPALLVLDVDMPEINGLELCQLLRRDAQWCHLPVLFLTAYRDTQTQDQVFTSGADDYLTKPVVPAELATRMLNRLERVKLIREQTV
jgi:DNA-binding response OmpR family regulator